MILSRIVPGAARAALWLTCTAAFFLILDLYT